MKRFLAYLTVVVVALAAALAGIGPSGTQGDFYQYMPVQGNGDECEISATLGHAVAYAENGTYSQSQTCTNYSPRSGFHTASTGGNVPSYSPEGHRHKFRCIPIIGVPCRSGAKLYVLRV